MLRREISARITADRSLLDELRKELQSLKGQVRRIQPRTTTAISLVGTDGGNNSIAFDPFLIQIVRVVDSSNNEYCLVRQPHLAAVCPSARSSRVQPSAPARDGLRSGWPPRGGSEAVVLEAISPTSDIAALGARQFGSSGEPTTALGEMMAYLEVTNLAQLSHMIRPGKKGDPISPTWVQVYRELMEWAILFKLVRQKDFGTDTIVVFDGLLRSKAFAGDLFRRLIVGLQEGIVRLYRRSRRRLYVAGVSKRSKVLDRYRLAMALEGIMASDFPAYVEIPREIEEKAYVWAEYARGNDREGAGSAELNKFVGGKMFFVKFGRRPRDPIWPVDIFEPQVGEAPVVLGCMLSDALDGFPVPLYPRCLQKAHENAALVDFDFTVLQDHIFGGIREILGSEAPILDTFRLQDLDPAQERYG